MKRLAFLKHHEHLAWVVWQPSLLARRGSGSEYRTSGPAPESARGILRAVLGAHCPRNRRQRVGQHPSQEPPWCESERAPGA